MRILVINNDGGGFADYVDVEPGLPVAELFRRQTPDGRAERLPDPRQSPADAARPSPPGRRSRQLHAHQDRRSLTLPERRRAGTARRRVFFTSSLERTRWRLHHRG